MPRPVHFEIFADQPERALAFYGQVFGWTFQEMPGGTTYWLVTTGADDESGINGGLLQRPEPAGVGSPTGYVCTLNVDDVDRYEAQVVNMGGGVAMPKMAVPGVGWLVYCTDSEGNIFGMMQMDP